MKQSAKEKNNFFMAMQHISSYKCMDK